MLTINSLSHAQRNTKTFMGPGAHTETASATPNGLRYQQEYESGLWIPFAGYQKNTNVTIHRQTGNLSQDVFERHCPSC